MRLLVISNTQVRAADEAGVTLLQQTLTNCQDDTTARCKINAALKREGLEEASVVTEPVKASDSQANAASFTTVPAGLLLLSIGVSKMISFVNFN